MICWLTTVLYALMLACAVLPVQAASSVPAIGEASSQTLAQASAQDDDMARVVSEPAHAEGGFELPELFLNAAAPASTPWGAEHAVPQRVSGRMPWPFLKGPQRPPQSCTV